MEPTILTDTQQKTPPAKTERQIIDEVLKYKKQYEEATQDQRTELADIYSSYMGKMDEVKELRSKSRETIPKLRTEISYVKPMIFSGEPEIEVEGIGDEDKFISQILEKIVNYRIQESIPNAYEKIEDWVHQAVTFGTSVLKVIWRFQVKDNGDGTSTPIQDEPDFEVPNILDVYVNPIIGDIASQPCIIFRSILPLEEVKQNPAYNFVGVEGKRNADLLETSGGIHANEYDSSSLTRTDLPDAQQKSTEGMVEILEMVTKERIQTVAIGNKEMLLRDVENPDGFIAAVKFVFEKNTIPNRFNGLGVGHNTGGLGKMIYQMFNQTLDNVKLSNNPMFMFLKGIGIDKRQLVSRPAGGIEVDPKNRSLSESIQPIIFPDIKQGAIEIMNKLDDEHKRASGANDLVQGSASNKTLGQDQLAQSNASNRFELIQRRFKHALADVAEMLIKMELRNLQSPDASILRIFPQEVRQQIYQVLITEAQNVKYNIRVKGDTTIARNKDMESQRLISLFDLGQNFLLDKEKRALLRRIAERQGENNIDELIVEENPVATQQEQMMAQQGLMMQGQAPQEQYSPQETTYGA